MKSYYLIAFCALILIFQANTALHCIDSADKVINDSIILNSVNADGCVLIIITNPVSINYEISVNNRLVKKLKNSAIIKDLKEGEYSLNANLPGFDSLKANFRINRKQKVSLMIDTNKDYKGNKYLQLYINGILQINRDRINYDEMILVNGDSFIMGSDKGFENERPAHEVSLMSYEISRCEVTKKLWRMIVNSDSSCYADNYEPVSNITWFEAIDFCNKLSLKEKLEPCYSINDKNVSCDFSKNGYRLPTEAEWEFAAQGGEKSIKYIYSGSDNLDDVAIYSQNYQGLNHIIGTKIPNELGLFDMSGNVYEWCWDQYKSYDNNQKNYDDDLFYKIYQHTENYRVYRGGCRIDDPSYCRTTKRFASKPDKKSNLIGFRLVRSIIYTIDAMSHYD